MQDYLCPRFFGRFSCKMGACRRSCCEGWPVTVSMGTYFRLLGLDCTPRLRRRLDDALKPLDRPTAEEYARFTPNWLGDCPMRMEDGRCSLHAELGEGVLSDVCRLYPRGVRKAVDGEGLEISPSNSCEAVIELLFAEREPMTFARQAFDVPPPPHPGEPVIPPSAEHPGELRFSLIRAMQERDKSLADRVRAILTVLGAAAPACDPAVFGYRLFSASAEKSDSLAPYAALFAPRYENAPERIARDADAFFKDVPNAGIRLEQVLVNHMFYTQFPFHGLDAAGEGEAFFGVFALLSAVTAAAHAVIPGEDGLSDAVAALFRFVEHTRFYENYHRTAAHISALPSK